jgi:hypothetical protein
MVVGYFYCCICSYLPPADYPAATVHRLPEAYKETVKNISPSPRYEEYKNFMSRIAPEDQEKYREMKRKATTARSEEKKRLQRISN